MHQKPDIAALLESLHHPSLQAIEPGLPRVQRLLNALGNPEFSLPPVIHVAGTNGKGSTCAYLTAIFQAAGLKVHRYISPHLVTFNERIMLADQEISDASLKHYLALVQPHIAACPVTFFEATTAAAFLAFADTPADVCILETGMGGRLDATNVIDCPLLSIITPISMDHQHFLGDSIDKIAFEKAGIMKLHVPCIIGAQCTEALGVLEAVAASIYTPTRVYGKDWRLEGSNISSHGKTLELRPSLHGTHQLQNAATAAAAALECATRMPEWHLDTKQIQQGISQALWPARLQRLLPPHPFAAVLANAELWLDGGHNEGAAEQLAEWMKYTPTPRTLVVGMLHDKDAKSFISAIADSCDLIVAIQGFSDSPKTHSSDYLQMIARQYTPHVIAENSIDSAISILCTRDVSGTVLICGSLYLAGKVLSVNQSDT